MTKTSVLTGRVLTNEKVVVLTKVVFWTIDCIRKKPGEPVRACRCSGAGVRRGAWWWWGTRDMGYGGVGRSLVLHRGTGPGTPPPPPLASLGPPWPHFLTIFGTFLTIFGTFRNFSVDHNSELSCRPQFDTFRHFSTLLTPRNHALARGILEF